MASVFLATIERSSARHRSRARSLWAEVAEDLTDLAGGADGDRLEGVGLGRVPVHLGHREEFRRSILTSSSSSSSTAGISAEMADPTESLISRADALDPPVLLACGEAPGERTP